MDQDGDTQEVASSLVSASAVWLTRKSEERKLFSEDLVFGRGFLNQPRGTVTGIWRSPSTARTLIQLGRGRGELIPDHVTERSHTVRQDTRQSRLKEGGWGTSLRFRQARLTPSEKSNHYEYGVGELLNYQLGDLLVGHDIMLGWVDEGSTHMGNTSHPELFFFQVK